MQRLDPSIEPRLLPLQLTRMRERLEYIDAMRGIAALLVVLQHALEQAFPRSPVLQVVSPGRFGVVLFFLISGFVVPFSIKGERPISTFIINRAARLLPALWLSIGVLLLIKGPVSPAALLANMLMLQWPLGQQLISAVYWTLTFELFFYAFCAFAFAAGIIRSVPQIGALVLGIATLAVLKFDERILFAAYLLAGTLLRLTLLDPDRGAKAWAALLLLPLLAAGALLGLGRDIGNPEMVPLAIAVSNTAPIVVFVLVIMVRPTVPRWSLWLGSASYSIYLFQDVGLLVLRPLISASPIGYIAAVFAVTIAIAAIAWRLIERPFIDLGRTVTKRTGPEAV